MLRTVRALRAWESVTSSSSTPRQLPEITTFPPSGPLSFSQPGFMAGYIIIINTPHPQKHAHTGPNKDSRIEQRTKGGQTLCPALMDIERVCFCVRTFNRVAVAPVILESLCRQSRKPDRQLRLQSFWAITGGGSGFQIKHIKTPPAHLPCFPPVMVLWSRVCRWNAMNVEVRSQILVAGLASGPQGRALHQWLHRAPVVWLSVS